MGKPAARLTDMHVCPMITPGLPPIPHVGGPIIGPGCPTVLIGGMPAAVMGDMCVCVGPPDTIILGSVGVMIGGKPAARMGDSCVHGGTIVLGCPTVLIGEVSPVPNPPSPPDISVPGMLASPGPSQPPAKPQPPPPPPIQAITAEPAIQDAMNETAAFATKISRIDALINGAENGDEVVHKHNEEDCTVQYTVTGLGDAPAKDVQYEIKTSDGKVFSGKTDSNGMTQKISGYTKGMCEITFPE
jgi:uncharacterized Zn-binding protein involved in type VI secretion